MQRKTGTPTDLTGKHSGPHNSFCFQMQSQLERLQTTVKGYLTTLGDPFVYSSFDQTFYDQCIEGMVKRGWSASTQAVIRSLLPPSIVMSLEAYPHICRPTQIFIAFYTAFMIFLDDTASKENLDLLMTFSKDLMQKRSHGNEVLDALAELLREIPEHYGDMGGGIILSTTLRYITSVVMEEEVSQYMVSTLLY